MAGPSEDASVKNYSSPSSSKETGGFENWIEEPVITIGQLLGEIVVLIVKIIWLILESIVKLFIPAVEKSVKGEITVITGAGHGIGRELAYQYASNGATVVCLDINKESNEETAKEISKLGYPKAYAYVCNVTKREEVFAVANQIQQDVGDVSILINNAGILLSENFLESPPEHIERTMNINVMAHFWTIKAFLPRMLELNHGHIVAMSSCAGLVGIKYLITYCTSKFAVRGMMEALYQELRINPNCQVKLTTIFPHMVDTGLCKKPVIRLPTITPMVKPLDAAKHIIRAQRRNVRESSIPDVMLLANTICRVLPQSVAELLFDFLGIYIKPDS